ncbi:related to formaldehyde dehydrogenase [Phialocephala subalpina]|uniref:Related to formaldehyde dehydrogenase n=1 Tax=Phialocephala subalpina TaxID=576137 RepID=A0A1L7X6U1_9HELO|nr:related to formaldehyde dehydrogenase [Phialocephala subalpina]
MGSIETQKMKAVQWEGTPFSVSVNEVPIPTITDPLDIIVRLTSAAICGTDLHTYHGRVPTPKDLTLGHENMGIVHEIGSDITTVAVGDRVLVSAVCDKGTNNGDVQIVGSYGVGSYVGQLQGGALLLNGGQAEYLRVPFANVNVIKLPAGKEHELDYLLLTDIWPTAWWALECAGQVLGDSVVVFGAGPVGLLCAYSALLRGATRVYSVDHIPARLAKAKSIGAIPIDFSTSDPVAQIMKLEPNGVDRACDCVGFECVDATGKNVEHLVVNWAVNVTRVGGGIGLIGVYLLGDLKPATDSDSKGDIQFPAGLFWVKSLSMKGGTAQLRLYQDLLKGLIESGKAKPSFVFEKEFSIEQGKEAFKEFSEHKLVKAVFKF